jgi:hypothetical protein
VVAVQIAFIVLNIRTILIWLGVHYISNLGSFSRQIS